MSFCLGKKKTLLESRTMFLNQVHQFVLSFIFFLIYFLFVMLEHCNTPLEPRVPWQLTVLQQCLGSQSWAGSKKFISFLVHCNCGCGPHDKHGRCWLQSAFCMVRVRMRRSRHKWLVRRHRRCRERRTMCKGVPVSECNNTRRQQCWYVVAHIFGSVKFSYIIIQCRQDNDAYLTRP